MADDVVTEWALDGVLDELARVHEGMRDRQFAFILGAGASFTSGIPTGRELAQRWLQDLHLRECVDHRSLNDWIASVDIGSGGLTWETAADHYPQIFERRFEGDREAGYAELEAAMEGKSPSLGYSLLAEIIQHTRHKVVVTTNFDNLVADALAMHAHQSPLVVAHESLAGFVRPQLRRPLVAKIHRDLFLHPLNDPTGVSTMEQGWKIALRKLFQYFTPVVVGYGGNDGSLMDMLVGLDGGDIAGRMVWCYREGAAPPTKAFAVLRKHRGLLVKIAGFDEFMLQLAAKLVSGFDVAAIAERTARLGQERAERYREQAAKLRRSSARGSAAEQKAGVVLNESVRAGASWWAYQMKAEAAEGLEERAQVYIDGLREFPSSAELAGNYANFLADQRRDYDAAETMYIKSLQLDPNSAITLGNYAIFLSERGEDERAETMFKRALALDRNHANTLGAYAHFLTEKRKNYDEAESLFKKMIEVDPTDPAAYARYAVFLSDRRRNYDLAEELYKKAIELDPSSADSYSNYAVFLADNRKSSDAAKAMFEKALEMDPNDPTIIANYAVFLADDRKDYNSAEALYEKALALDPRNVDTAGNYASFLAYQRKDDNKAEAMFKKALELDSASSRQMVNYASMLLTRGDKTSLDAVLSLVQRALAISSPKVSQSVAEGLLYAALVEEITHGQPAGAVLGRLKGALLADFARESWDFSPIFESALPQVAATRRELFRAIGDAILNEKRMSALDVMGLWREIPAVEPFSPNASSSGTPARRVRRQKPEGNSPART